MSTDARVRPSPPPCRTCGQTQADSLTCGRCRRAHYCSVACQKADWPRHKPECRPADAVAVPTETHLHQAQQAAALYALGINQEANGQIPAAQQSLEQALVLFEALLGPKHTQVAACCHVLALVFYVQAAYDQASALYQRALAIYETNHGPDHPKVAAVLANWGDMLSQQGHNAQARPLIQRALAIHEKVHGPNHADAATCLVALAKLYHEERRYSEALPLHQQVLAIRETTPHDIQSLCFALHNVGDTFHALGNLSAARPLLKRALATAEATFGPSHVHTGTVLNSMGNLLVAEGDATAALAVFQRALAIFEAAHVPNHPNVAAVSINIARLFEQQPETRTQARALFKRARDINAASRPGHDQQSSAAREYAHMRATQPCRSCGMTGKWEKCGRCQNEWLLGRVPKGRLAPAQDRVSRCRCRLLRPRPPLRWACDVASLGLARQHFSNQIHSDTQTQNRTVHTKIRPCVFHSGRPCHSPCRDLSPALAARDGRCLGGDDPRASSCPGW